MSGKNKTNNFFKQKFDLIISIGEDCACSSWLRRYHLQNYTYPFDWLTKASFETRINLLCNDFKDFCLKENIIPLEKPKQGLVDNKCDYYKDIKNDFFFYHDFESNQTFDIEYTKVFNKYQRRITRLYKLINNKKSILFVWWSRDKHISKIILEKAYNELVKKFETKQIYLLIIEPNVRVQDFYYENGHILVKQFDNISYDKNKPSDEVMGNIENNSAVFSKIKIKMTCKDYIKYVIYLFVKLFIELIPIKSFRDKLRFLWKFRFYYRARL